MSATMGSVSVKKSDSAGSIEPVSIWMFLISGLFSKLKLELFYELDFIFSRTNFAWVEWSLVEWMYPKISGFYKHTWRGSKRERKAAVVVPDFLFILGLAPVFLWTFFFSFELWRKIRHESVDLGKGSRKYFLACVRWKNTRGGEIGNYNAFTRPKTTRFFNSQGPFWYFSGWVRCQLVRGSCAGGTRFRKW